MKSSLAALVAIAMTVASVQAAPIPSKVIVKATVDSRAVIDRLCAIGIAPDRANAIVAQLSAADVHQLATNIEQVQRAGGTKEWVIAAVVVVIAIALIASTRHGPATIQGRF